MTRNLIIGTKGSCHLRTSPIKVLVAAKENLLHDTNRLLINVEKKDWGNIYRCTSILGQVNSFVKSKGKILIMTDAAFVKSHERNNAVAHKLLENEDALMRRFNSDYCPRLLCSGTVDGRFILVYERFPGRTLNEGWVTSSDARVISRHLEILLIDLKESGIVHNDMRPQNLLWNPCSKRLLVIDFEYATPVPKETSVTHGNEFATNYFSRFGETEEEKRFIADRLKNLGRKWRSNQGLCSRENDRYAIEKIIMLLTNRRRYIAAKCLQFLPRKIQRNLKRHFVNFG